MTKHLIEPQAIDDNGMTEFEIEMAEKQQGTKCHMPQGKVTEEQ